MLTYLAKSEVCFRMLLCSMIYGALVEFAQTGFLAGAAAESQSQNRNRRKTWILAQQSESVDLPWASA